MVFNLKPSNMNNKKHLVYCIENEVNGKKYIGKTTKDLGKRLKEHFKKAKEKVNRRLYDSINHHGEENFKITLIIEVDSNELANEMEIKYISILDTQNPKKGYNMTRGGDGGNTGKYFYGKSPYDFWVEKYGKEKADEIKKDVYIKVSEKAKLQPRRPLTQDEKNRISKMQKKLRKEGNVNFKTPLPRLREEHHEWKDIDLDSVIELCKEGKSLRKISLETGYSEFCIRDRIKRVYNKSFYEISKEVKLNFKTESQIFNETKNLLENNHRKTVEQISKDIGIKTHLCRSIFKKNTGLTLEGYRNHVLKIPLNNFPRKSNSFELDDIKHSLSQGNNTIKEVARSLNVSIDLIQEKLKKNLGITFTEFKNTL